MGAASVPLGAVRATCALLDFLYLAQYPSHSDETLEYLQSAIDEFHVHKDVFLNLDARLGMSQRSSPYNFALTEICLQVVISIVQSYICCRIM